MAKKAKTKEQQHFFDKQRNVKIILWVFFSLCAISLALDFVVQRYTYHSWERLTGFYPLFGFTAYVALVAVAAGFRKLVMRPEDYYDKKEQKR